MTDHPASPSSPTPGARATGVARVHALVAAGGSGSRVGGPLPKQYMPVGGQAMLARTLHALGAAPDIELMAVVVAPDDRRAKALCSARHLLCPQAGATRAATVRAGLDALLGAGAALSDWVLVHDAARCLVTPALVQRLIDACREHPVGGLLAVPLADTLKLGDGQHVRQTLPRADKWLAQTPQMFRLGVLRDALDAAGEGVTDESSAIEALGLQPLLVPGSARNFKITWPEDFALAAALLAADAASAPPETQTAGAAP